jgi:membrane protein implicated in regulation of membrane protease activity
VGRAPLTIVIGSSMIGWGLVGLAVTDTLRRDLHWPPVLVVGPALAAAAAGSVAAAKLFGELSARLMPKDESYAIGREGLLGLTGKVVYPITETGGRVHLFDQYRTLHVKPARVRPGQAPIEKGTEVIVASMDPEQGSLIVEPLGFQRSAVSRPPAGVIQKSEREVQVREPEG